MMIHQMVKSNTTKREQSLVGGNTLTMLGDEYAYSAKVPHARQIDLDCKAIAEPASYELPQSEAHAGMQVVVVEM
jgi:hypothetical protein